jgi:hypothetical protein
MCENKVRRTRIGKAAEHVSMNIPRKGVCDLTAMGPKQIEQSWEEPLAGGFPKLFNSRKRL